MPGGWRADGNVFHLGGRGHDGHGWTLGVPVTRRQGATGRKGGSGKGDDEGGFHGGLSDAREACDRQNLGRRLRQRCYALLGLVNPRLPCRARGLPCHAPFPGQRSRKARVRELVTGSARYWKAVRGVVRIYTSAGMPAWTMSMRASARERGSRDTWPT